ncbi:HAD-IIIC family phosphatase [Mariniflexile litorale]|uniref:HAD-IIIC family phosphatase n=1 Tax=Mariniflexile litorale TaxID=3045158 RepID=A0AAU7EBM7_9FLAO|nr:HAD-IIIC family phosphatase [Mariniflexile sp. KMM 9835]MDQ8213429.1 HAD-IIIC family phosphatase [Mariniflexile sp. KMM 9835]
MYESEVYIKTIQEHLPQEICEHFFDTYASIRTRSVLHWTEHCTECAMPSCFKTCDLYSPRIDGKCQRFVKGIERVILKNEIPTVGQQILKIQFKKWGVFATQGNNELYNCHEVEKKETRELLLAKLIHLVPQKDVKKKLIQKRYSQKKNKIISEQNKGLDTPDGFLIEVYNPTQSKISLGLVIRNDDFKFSKIPFQYRMDLMPGYNKEIIPFDEISKRVKINMSYRINLIPEDQNMDTALYFGITEFVQFIKDENVIKEADKIKCIVWDLDNTLWSGTLVEDGIEKLKLKEGITDVLKLVEQKGIINSIASKNDHDSAVEALKHFGVEDYFVFPKISWLPKSKSLKEIALDLNININTFLFIDDSEFERKEIETTLPQVRVMDAIHYQKIPDLEALQIPITNESKHRKTFYINEVERKKVSDSFEGEYLNFIQTCNIELEIEALKEVHFQRVYELTQRTNQMNFSGSKYTKNDISNIYNNEDLSSYVLSCRDRFGDYGIIGFGVIQKSKNQLVDLMFSCRIQSKRIEHAFLTHVLEHYLKFGDFWVTYNHTEKNKFSAHVFVDFGFEIIKSEGTFRKLKFNQNKEVHNDKIIKVIEIK